MANSNVTDGDSRYEMVHDISQLRNALANQEREFIVVNSLMAIDLNVVTGQMGQLDVNRSVTIAGWAGGTATVPGVSVEISANNQSRVFNVAGPANTNVVLAGLIITDGHAFGETGTGSSNGGAGILHVGGNLTVVNSIIAGNTSGNHGAGIHSAGAQGTRLIIANSVIAGNTVDGGDFGSGGGVFSSSGRTDIVNSTIVENTASEGAGVRLTGSNHVYNTIVALNIGGNDVAISPSAAFPGTNNLIGTVEEGRVLGDNLHGVDAELLDFLPYEEDSGWQGRYHPSDDSIIVVGTSGTLAHVFRDGSVGDIEGATHVANGLDGTFRDSETTRVPIGAYDGGLMAPSGFTVGVATATAIELYWNRVAGADGYIVQYRLGETGAWTPAAGIDVVDNGMQRQSHVVSGLVAGQQYFFRIQAYIAGTGTPSDPDKQSDWVTAGPGIPATNLPAIPNILAHTATPNSITLNWAFGSNATTFTLQWRIAGEAEWAPENLATLNGSWYTSYMVANLAANTMYEFLLTGSNLGTPPAEREAPIYSARTLVDPNSDVPAVPTITATATAHNSITVNWEGHDKDNVTGYEIQYRRAGETGWVPFNTSTGQPWPQTLDSVDVDVLNPWTVYEFRVRAQGGGNSSEWSLIASARTYTQGSPAPDIPTGFDWIDRTHNSFTLQWDGVAGVTRYEIRVYIAPPGEEVIPQGSRYIYDTPTSGQQVYIVDGLQANTQYRFELRAVTDAGDSQPDNPWVYEYTLATPPSGFEAFNVTHSSLTLRWDAVESAVNYVIESRLANTQFATLVTLPGTFTEFHVSDLNPLTWYDFRIHAVPVSGAPTAWNEIQVRTEPDPGLPAPNTPDASDFSFQSTGLHTGQLTWTAVDHAESYVVQYRTKDVTNQETWQNVGATTATVHIPNLNEMGWYEFRIRSIGPGGESEFSTVWEAEHDPRTLTLITPAPPTGMAVTQSQINVSWNSVPRATDYQLQILRPDADPETGWENYGIPTNLLSMQVTGLIVDSYYQFRVIAGNEAPPTGEKSHPSAASTPIKTLAEGEVAANIFATPEILAIRGVATNMVEIVWTKVTQTVAGTTLPNSDLIDYRLEYSIDGTAWHAITVPLGHILWGEGKYTVNSQGIAVKDNGGRDAYVYVLHNPEFTEGQTLQVRVSAVSLDTARFGDSSVSNTLSGNTMTQAAANSVTGIAKKPAVRAVNAKAGINFVTMQLTGNMSWQNNNNNQAYKIEVGTGSGARWNTLTASKVMTTIYVTADRVHQTTNAAASRVDIRVGVAEPAIAGRINTLGQTYRFAVTAMNANGDTIKNKNGQEDPRAGSVRTLTAKQATPKLTVPRGVATVNSVQFQLAKPTTGIDAYELRILGRVIDNTGRAVNNVHLATIKVNIDANGVHTIEHVTPTTDMGTAIVNPLADLTIGAVRLDDRVIGSGAKAVPGVGVEIAGLQSGQRYTIQVRSIDAIGRESDGYTLREPARLDRDVFNRVNVSTLRYAAPTIQRSVAGTTAALTLRTPATWPLGIRDNAQNLTNTYSTFYEVAVYHGTFSVNQILGQVPAAVAAKANLTLPDGVRIENPTAELAPIQPADVTVRHILGTAQRVEFAGLTPGQYTVTVTAVTIKDGLRIESALGRTTFRVS
ncbi:MAG: fibronectin type III domain-containing protein [Planctomycetaceae bacterium]|nr:fibronectin type III domain-containing protein [Planctomycetaceae bacterium]